VRTPHVITDQHKTSLNYIRRDARYIRRNYFWIYFFIIINLRKLSHSFPLLFVYNVALPIARGRDVPEGNKE
jgi:hypothetical protein